MAFVPSKADNKAMTYQNYSWVEKALTKRLLYERSYLFLYEDEAKPYKRISKKGMYAAILDFFTATPWAFYTMMSPETYRFILDRVDGKTLEFPLNDPRHRQDDFFILNEFFVLDFQGEINADYLPLIQQMRQEDQPRMNAVLERFSLLKGLLDLYGYIDNATLLEKYNAAAGIELSMKDLRSLCATTLFSFFYHQGPKYTCSLFLGTWRKRKKDFLLTWNALPDLPYANFTEAEILAYANHFYFPPWKKEAERFYSYYGDRFHFFSIEEDPRPNYEKRNWTGEEAIAYDRFNALVPKWFLKGHTLAELAGAKAKEKKPIVKIDEKDIGPEIFFPFKDTIVGVYTLAKEHLHLSGDVATGEIPWENLEKIKAEFYAHREDYLKRYIDSLSRNLTPYEKGTVEGLRHAITSRFIFHSLSREGAVLIDTNDGKRYLVHPLGMGFSEMLEGGYYDEIVSTTILPFEDYITYDSYISGSSLLIATNDPQELEQGKLIRSLKDFASLA